MPAEYRFLLRQGRPAGASVEDHYTRADLAARPVVRDERRNLYLVFETREELLAWHGGLPEDERCCHEVVFGYAPQRLKFDIDAPADRLAALWPESEAAADSREADSREVRVADAAADAELSALLGLEEPRVCVADAAGPEVPKRVCVAAHAIMTALITAVLAELADSYLVGPTRQDLAVTDSSGPTPVGWKYSFHLLVLPYVVADSEEARSFTARVLARLAPEARPFVDPGVNKKIQCFRLAGSAKPGTGRVKVATDAAFGTARVGPADLFVTARPEERVLPRHAAAEPAAAPSAALGEGVAQAALALAARQKATEGHALRETRGQLLIFGRVAPSHCTICGETHHHDNTLLLRVAPAGRGRQSVTEYCRQAPGRSRLLGELKAEPGAAEKRLASLIAEGPAEQPTEFEGLPDAQKTVYDAPAMRDYELCPTLAVRAAMKLGKTKAVRRYVDQHFPAGGLETAVVRFVTFRQTFSASLAADFPDFTVYSDARGALTAREHPRLIVQVESLHRLALGDSPEPIDLLVVDEAESVLAQFSSGLHRHFNAAFAMFQWMLGTARHVVFLDANLGDRAFRALARMRPAHPARLHWNRHARAAGDTFCFTADHGAWLARLHEAVGANQKVVVPTNSLAEARAYEAGLRQAFPLKQIALYSSETPPGEKARHFGDVHAHWGGLDVLIYTPTCSAGVSFEREHFDVLFGFFCDASCDVETCRQMLGRVRSISEHHICIRAVGATLPTDVGEIRRLLYSRRALLQDAGVPFDYTPDGQVRFYESEYFHLWLETVRVTNLSRNDFARRFVSQVASSGARVSAWEGASAAPSAAAATLSAAHRAARCALTEAHAVKVAAAAELSNEDLALAREALSAQQDVSAEVRLGCEKSLLRETYNWFGRPLDKAFVLKLGTKAARRVYHNLCVATSGVSMAASLESLRSREAARYAQVVGPGPGPGEWRDLAQQNLYTYQGHALAWWLLRICGFSCLLDTREVGGAALAGRLRGGVAALAGAAGQMVHEFEMRRPNFNAAAAEVDDAAFLDAVLRHVNKALCWMYGRRVAGKKTRYRLAWSATGRLFDVVDEVAVLYEAGNAAPARAPRVISRLAAVAADADAVFYEEEFYR